MFKYLRKSSKIFLMLLHSYIFQGALRTFLTLIFLNKDINKTVQSISAKSNQTIQLHENTRKSKAMDLAL